MKKFLIIAIALIAIIGGVFFFYRLAYAPHNDGGITPKRNELSGAYVCLPLRDTSVPDPDCTVGLHTDTGEYYAIDFGLYVPGTPPLVEGDMITANGVVTPIENLSTDYWQKYPVTGIFSVTDSLLVEERREEEPVGTSTASTTLTSGRWVWKYTDLLDETRRESTNDAYKLSFHDDLTYESATDCNALSGTYVVDNEVLSLGQPAMTKMFCEGSEEMAYVSELELTNSYVIEGNTLRLNLNRDFGTMVFSREE